jgi:hypothetical protein
LKPEPATPPVLPPRYYLDNFQRLREAVEARYGDLLSAEEHAVLAAFDALPAPARCLYLRLLSRVGPWFRASRLAYAEIGPPGPALDALVDAGLAIELDQLPVAELGQLFTRQEIAALYAEALPGAARLAKGPLLEAVAALGEDDHARWARLQACAPERVVAPLAMEVLEVLQLLFFGNRRQGLLDFVLSDLGVARYYPYALDRETRLFPDRAALEAVRTVGELADLYWQWREDPEPDPDVLPALAGAALALEVPEHAAQRPWWRLLNRLGRDCERQGAGELALALYAASGRHPARERRARVLEAAGDEAAALAAVETMLAEPWCEAEAAAAERMARRLRRRVHGRPQPRPRDRFPVASLTVVRASGSVERDSAATLEARDGRPVFFLENTLFTGLFGLAFWEQLFAPVPGAFHHPYQAGPADAFSASFRERRRAAIEQRFEELAAADLPALLAGAFRRYQGYQCHWVNWRALDEALVERAARCIPFDHLAGTWQRLLFDPADNRRGFPDLVALGEAPGDYALYEVKGPGDALQEHQRRWLNHFADLGMPASVLQVRWADG